MNIQPVRDTNTKIILRTSGVHGNWKASSRDLRISAGPVSPFSNQTRAARNGLRKSAWFAAVLTAGFALPAQAQFWTPDTTANYREAMPQQIEQRPEHRRPRATRTREKLPDAPKESAKPVGPVIIAISIEKQQLKLYDQNGLFAETPVSTGMRGHSTPMGVFSIIQKNKYHRSNIYSGAPMPYMQRITWSGVALHAGVLPGYPASHGCIRMPMNFAMRMWGWTRMGARVIITPGEITPADFSHPLLATRKTEPVAAASSPQQHAETTPKSDKSAIADAALDKSDLRLTPIHDRIEPVRTADASGVLPQKSDADMTAKPDVATAPDDKQDDAKPADQTSEAPQDAPKSADLKDADQKNADPKADKDQTRMTEATASVTADPVSLPQEGAAEFIGPVKPRSGHIAAFVSRKTNKLYVRQNFEPWFETPVTIAASDRPLGTHVFTVRADKSDTDALRWSVVSLPAPSRAARPANDMPRRKHAVAAEAAPPAPPSSPAEALGRLSVSDDAMKRIASALAPGGSLIVSDQGLGDETGRGTDFIVQLR